MERIDRESLEFICGEYNKYHEGYECGIQMRGEEEDYGLDLFVTGITEAGAYYETEYEAKTIRKKFNWEYLTKVAGRNRYCRYCESASTVEEFETDTTPMPEFLAGDKPIHVINSTTRNGELKGKIHKMLEARAGLIFLREGEILVYTPKALKNAILGYLWIKCKPTTDFSYEPPHWERKAAIDLTKYSYKIKCKVPEDLLK